MLVLLLVGTVMAVLDSGQRQTSGRPTGLFVDVKELGKHGQYNTTVHAALELICSTFSFPTSPLQTNKYLALDHTTFPAPIGFLSDAIDSIAKYFPCFEEIHFGLADNHYTDDIYCQGVVNTTFQTSWVSRSLAAASLVDKRYGHLFLDPTGPKLVWYLNYEAAGNYFETGCSRFKPASSSEHDAGSTGNTNASVSAAAFSQGYVDMFKPLTVALMKIRQAGVMWSPTFNFPWSQVCCCFCRWCCYSCYCYCCYYRCSCWRRLPP